MIRAVYKIKDKIVNFGPKDVAFLEARAAKTDQKRIRFCAHKSAVSRLQEMLIAVEKGSYVRPARHVTKDESMHVVKGTADLVFFDGRGRVTQVVRLGSFESGRQFYCRVPKAAYHMLLVRSKQFIFHEAAEGPFQRSGTVFPAWAPEQGDSPEARAFFKRVEVQIKDL